MGLYRLLWKASQWNSTRAQVRLPSIKHQRVAKVSREGPQQQQQRWCWWSPPPPPREHSAGVYGAITWLLGRKCYGTSTQMIPRDVVLFQDDRTRFARLLATFCVAQATFWTYLAHFAYTGLRHDGSAQDPGERSAAGIFRFWSFDMNLGNSAWRYGFTAGCLAVGLGVLGVGTLFCRRSVSRVVLHKGGKTVTVATQSPLGSLRGHQVTVPLSRVACHAHRSESPSFIPLKIKDYKFYFLLDKNGTINNVKLFDVTVGAYRPL
ncbi:hypothetical protein CRUP_024501 [Coryphaenoides rupestris]|nr:hypothetical protein CRUP_024501 [Coryphaenoides rupestris]